MSFIDYFSTKKGNTAELAKERLQIIVAHERNQRCKPDYLPQMQKEIVAKCDGIQKRIDNIYSCIENNKKIIKQIIDNL